MRSCSFEGCGRVINCRGLCWEHVEQARHGLPLKALEKKRRIWTDAEIDRAVAWRAEGKQLRWIAEQFNCTVGAIWRVGSKRGKSMRSPVPAPPDDGLTAAQRRYQKRKAAGLCITCGRPAREDMATCRLCNVKANLAKKRRDSGVVEEEPVDNTPRCRCFLRLPCNDCLPVSASAWALDRRDNGDAHIPLRSKAA